ncbi:MAG: hypothetical protein LUI06_01240 [Ruminococcus sp.]|nr:hypothetical protein [Ruminococcus sp.]
MSDDTIYKIFIKRIKHWETVPEEFYKEYMRDTSRFRQANQRRGLCFCSKRLFWLCDTDCVNCKFSKASKELSLDMSVPTEYGDILLAEMIPSDDEDILDAYVLSKLIEDMYDEMEDMNIEYKHMCELVMQGKSKREAARILGMSHSTFNYRFKKLTCKLRHKLEDSYQ